MNLKLVTRILTSQRGLTLVELLAVLVLFSMITGLITSMIISGMNQYKKINAEALIRDEADLVMTQFMNHLYTAYQAESMSSPSGTNQSLLKVTKTTGEILTIGFNHTTGAAVIDGATILSPHFSQEASTISYEPASHSIVIHLNLRHHQISLPSPMILESRIHLLRIDE